MTTNPASVPVLTPVPPVKVRADVPAPMQTVEAAPDTTNAGVAVAKVERKEKVRKPWTAWRVIRWAGLGLTVAVLSYIGWVYAAFLHLQNTIYVPLPPTITPNRVSVVSTATAMSVAGITVAPTRDPYEDLPSGRINILVLGSDKRPDRLGMSPRSDTLILVNLDTQTRTVRMLTIPRDLAVEIPGYPGKNKINAAYFIGERDYGPGGGAALAMQTVSKLLSVPVDYYVMVNFDGFRTLVDTLGGVDVDVPEEIDDYHYPSENPDDPFAEIHIHFDAGVQHLDGLDALRYARTRHADNDFGRSKRQLQIIVAMKRKAMSLDLLPKLPGLLDQLGGMIETNIPPDKQLPLLQAGYDLNPDRIITASIGADLIMPVRLPDRSEALNLNWKKAKPVLDQFFGRQPTATPTRTPRPTRTPIPTRTPTRTRTPVTHSPTPRAVTVTATPKRTPDRRTPTGTPRTTATPSIKATQATRTSVTRSKATATPVTGKPRLTPTLRRK